MNEENNKEVFHCEYCGKEHDGSYGSGRFCSDHCRRVYSGKRVNINGNQKCNFVASKENNGRKPYGTWKCERCNLIFKTRAQLFDHNHEVHPVPKGQIWNKGLTSETDNRIKKIVDSYMKLHKNFKSQYCGFYNGIKFEMSYELAWIIWNIDHNISFKRCDKSFVYFDTQLKKNRYYYPDFELLDGTIVEIKGYVSQNAIDKKYAMENIYKNIKYQFLTKSDIQHCIDYCIKKYGKNYLYVIKSLV